MKQSNNDTIKNKLTQHEFDFSEPAWEKMDTLLDNRKKAAYWKIIGTLLIFTALVIGVSFFMKKDNITIEQTNVQSTLLSTSTNENTPLNINQTTEQSSNLTTTPPIQTPFGSLGEAQDYPKGKDFFEELKLHLNKYNKHISPEKVYVHTDRTLYKSGEAVWFAVYVRDGLTLEPSPKSDIVYVEWLSPKGTIEKKLTLLVENGVAQGDIQLSPEAKGGMYKIKAYTNWQRNFLPSNSQKGEHLPLFEKDITIQKTVLPNLRMKLDFERKAYGSGDKVVADIELKNLENQALAVHTFTYRVKLQGSNILEKTAKTNTKGKASIEFQLPEKLVSTDGLLNVLVEYNGQTESISRSIPIVLNKINLQFMAEGGTLLENTENTVAFKAINEFGKAADVSGVIYDNQGNRVTTFKTYHMGMGSVNIKAQKGKTYFAKITQPKGIGQKYFLPRIEKEGIALHLYEQTADDLVISTISNQTDALFVALTANGKIYDTKKLTNSKTHIFKLSKKDIPAGIATITVLDKDKRPKAERLVFVNSDKRLNISIKTDKEKYQPREEVKASLKVTDHNGQPVEGSFSFAAVDDKLQSFADDKQANVLASLLLNSELRGQVEEPNFYFENNSPLSKELGEVKNKLKALDMLMLTQGWRKVSWVKEVKKPLAEIKFENEVSYIHGFIENSFGEPLVGVEVVLNKGEAFVKTLTNQNGYYRFKKRELGSSISIRSNKSLDFKFIKSYGRYNFIVPSIIQGFAINCGYKCFIKGRLVDAHTGEVLKNVKIVEKNSNRKVYSDEEGIFYLRAEGKNYDFQITHINYKEVNIPLKLKENEGGVLLIPLRSAPILHFEDRNENNELNFALEDAWLRPNHAKSIFGGEKIDIRPQGNIDLDFDKLDEKLNNLAPFTNSVNYSAIGYKLDLPTNYNSQASIDGTQLEYSGHEDEILQPITAGNVSLPLRSSLIQDNENLLGKKTEAKFGRLTVTSILSQQRSRRIPLYEKTPQKEIVIIPAEYETVAERIMIKAPSTRIEVIPAEYETVTETVLAKAESKKLITVPAEYETVTETIEVSPATTKWVKRKADKNCLSADPNDCQVWALVEVPARYEPITKTVLKTPATTKEVTVPAEYQQVTKRIVKMPAATRTIEVPAEYKTITKKVLVKPAVTKLINDIKGYETGSENIIHQYNAALNFNDGHYPVREFYHPEYENKDSRNIKERTDFRSTAFWQPIVKTDKNGEANLSFYNSDDLTTFKIIVEGIGNNGQVGQGEANYYSQLPFGMLMKAPPTVLTGDEIRLPLTLMNNTNKELSGKLNIQTPLSFIAAFENITEITLAPNEKRTIYLAYQVKKAIDGILQVTFEAEGERDAFRQYIKVLERGFPVKEVFGGKAFNQTHELTIQAPIEGTLNGRITIYPDVAANMVNSAERMFRQPTGCFEQVSSSNYPNLLVLDYLYEMNISNPKMVEKANHYLDIGYKKLIGYENVGGGFDWYGRGPAHEGLTAYGLMQFVDMSYVYPIDQTLINRTAEWLLSRRNGKGSWKYSKKNLHTWKVGNQISDAYIVWALCEANYGNEIGAEIEKSYKDAIQSQDPYLMALMANVLVKLNDNRAIALAEQLLDVQNENGSWDGKTHSITYSKDKYLAIETTALATLAIMQVNQWSEAQVENASTEKAINYLMSCKSSYGFGSTQSTVLAMKAIIEFAKTNKNIAQKDGTATIYINGKKAFEKYISIKNPTPTIITNLEGYLQRGKNIIKIVFDGLEIPLAHDISLNYATTSPISDEETAVQLTTKLNAPTTKVGNTLRLTSTIKNTTNEMILNPIAIIGIPSGLSLQPWQLKELQEKNAFDYYELMNGYIVFHFIQMTANERKVIHLDLKADIPGKYEAPASSAYLYYALDKKSWAEPMRVEIE